MFTPNCPFPFHYFTFWFPLLLSELFQLPSKKRFFFFPGKSPLPFSSSASPVRFFSSQVLLLHRQNIQKQRQFCFFFTFVHEIPIYSFEDMAKRLQFPYVLFWVVIEFRWTWRNCKKIKKFLGWVLSFMKVDCWKMKKSPLPMQNICGPEKQKIGKEALVKLLRWHFGHSEFRGKQLEAIEAVLSGFFYQIRYIISEPQ